jgi:hypothetical protein
MKKKEWYRISAIGSLMFGLINCTSWITEKPNYATGIFLIAGSLFFLIYLDKKEKG